MADAKKPTVEDALSEDDAHGGLLAKTLQQIEDEQTIEPQSPVDGAPAEDEPPPTNS